jgi:hypothetical protein
MLNMETVLSCFQIRYSQEGETSGRNQRKKRDKMAEGSAEERKKPKEGTPAEREEPRKKRRNLLKVKAEDMKRRRKQRETGEIPYFDGGYSRCTDKKPGTVPWILSAVGISMKPAATYLLVRKPFLGIRSRGMVVMKWTGLLACI